MRIALIDLGTNAVRFDVHDIGPDGLARRLHRERLAVRLGEGVFQRGRIGAAALRRTVAAFQSFHKTCRDLGVEKITAFGTSALRDASNSEIVLHTLRRRSGIDVRVISGQEEARLIAQGVLAHRATDPAPVALVDIGGGSVEITFCRGRRILRSSSFKLGAARLQQVFLKTVPPARGGGKDAPLKKLRRHIRSVLAEGAPRGGWPRARKIIGSAGTIRALERIHRDAGGNRLSPGDVERWAERFSTLTPAGLLRIPGMDPKRVDIILAGAVVLGEVAERLKANHIEATDFALRDGMLEEEIRGQRRGTRTSLGMHLGDIMATARRWGQPPTHLRNVERFARTLFDRLAPLHRLKPFWRDTLVAAACLQDVGEIVSPVHHERHSHYMVLHADVPGLENREAEFLAGLALWHKAGKPEKKEWPFSDKTKRSPFLKILALLRIVDALDKPRSHRVSLATVRRRPGAVRLFLRGQRAAVDLAVLRVEQKKELFEKVFNADLSAVGPG